jgi:hypothetical protein
MTVVKDFQTLMKDISPAVWMGSWVQWSSTGLEQRVVMQWTDLALEVGEGLEKEDEQ